MTDPNYRTTFGGIDDQTENATVPGWYRANVDATRGSSAKFVSFHDTLGDLRAKFPCELVDVAYRDNEGDEWVADDRQKALVNPEWLGDGREDAPQDTALWQVVTDSYHPTDHMDAFGPLVALARQKGHTDAFGTTRTYRNGGEVRIDILFDSLRADVPGEDDAIVLGFSLGQDYFRTQSIHGHVIAFDSRTGAAMRGLTEPMSVPHSNEDATEKVVEWLDGMFDRAEKVGDTIYQVVAEAREYEVDMAAIPLSVAEFYEAIGFPAGMSERAAEKVRDVNQPTAYSLYLPIAEELTTSYEGKVGGDALMRHATNANELLYSPASAERDALRAAAEDLQGQGTLGAEYSDAAEQLRDRVEDLDEAVGAFESARDRIRAMIQEVGEDGGDAEADESEVVEA